MVLIISSEVDHSTNNVIKWLIKNDVPFIRLGEQQFINSISMSLGRDQILITLKIGGAEVSLGEVSSFWYRKNTIEILSHLKINLTDDESDLRTLNLRKFLDDEIESIRQYLFFELEKKKHLGNINVGDGNKLISFSVAKECELLIPLTFISSELNFQKEAFEIGKQLIEKHVEDAFRSRDNGLGITSPYKIAETELFENKNHEIFPSCLQEYLDKKLELRIFYFKGEFYSMAIFSQMDTKTKVDFRNYNEEKPNRMLPYNLPYNIEQQLDQFMKKMNLKTGSIDMILTNENEYVFLEVNPVGQYGMVGSECNINLDKKIAIELST